MHWRQSEASSRCEHPNLLLNGCTHLNVHSDDLILYTITSDATLRIFLPVLDAPQFVQLHTSLDISSALPFSVASQVTTSHVFILDRSVMSDALSEALATLSTADEDARSRRVRDIKAESWDLFLRVLGDGSLIVQAVSVCQDNFDLPLPAHISPEYRSQTANATKAVYPSPVWSSHPASNPSTSIYIT